MTNKLRIIYESGLKNNQFLMDIHDAGIDKKPTFFSSASEKTAFATVYYGWLVGKYGKEWKANL